MKNNFQNWVSKQRIELIFYLPKLNFFLLMIPILWCIYKLFQEQKDSMIIILLLVIIVLSFFGIFINNLIRKSAYLMLYEKIDLQKITDYFNYAYSHIPVSQRKKFNYYCILNKAQVAFLRGKFEESLQLLNQIKSSEMFSSTSDRIKENQLYYEFLNYCSLSQFENAELLLDKLSKEYKESSEFILDILKGNVSDYAFEYEPHTRLMLISRSYYQALNLLNANDKSAAKEKFKKIADENPELFYVRESKKYLEELENE
ncbi:hypothetical protein [Streptococcus equinus]|uniref:hypothetical protein n=1 Tax=Streptococcus equinus TaxID=1335 RepID=UPI003BF88C1B